jgi:beta-mannanase
MRLHKIFVWRDDFRAINEFISNILSYNHNDDAKMVVDFIYYFETERSCLVQQSILPFVWRNQRKTREQVHEININRK